MLHFSGVIALIILFTALLWFAVGWWVSSIERAKQQRKRETEWNHHLNTLRRDRDAFRDQVEVAHGKIRVLENRRADGQSPPRSPEDEAASKALTNRLQSHLEEAKKQISGFARKVDTLREQSIEREDVLEQLKKKLKDTSRALHDREQKLAQLNGQEAPEAGTPVASLDDTASGGDSARYQEAIQQLRIEAQTRADAAEQDRQRLDHTISEHMQTIGALRAELAQRETLSSSNEPVDARLEAALQEIKSLREDNEQHAAKIEQLSQGSKVVEHQRSRLKELQVDYEEQREALEKLAGIADDLEKQRIDFDELQSENKTLQETISHLNQTQESMQEQRDQAVQQLAAVKEEALIRNESESMRQHTELSAQLSDHEQTIERLRQQAADREQEYDSELHRLRQAMDAQEQIVSQLRDVLSKPVSTVTRPAPPPSTPPSPLPQSGDLFAPRDPAPVSSLPSVVLYEQAPDSSDDLKKISGIGPVFERALNDLGVYEFEQIASLTDRDIEWVAESLRSFPDRIIKGGWIEQAQVLIAKRDANS